MTHESLKYNYVFFDSEDKRLKKDKYGYRYICSKDLLDCENVIWVTYPLDYAPFYVRLLFLIHNAPKTNCIINLPFKEKWYPYYFKNTFENDKPLCFIMSGRYLSVSYLRYLKKTYPSAKFVKIHRDLLELWKQRNPSFTDEIVNEIFDLSLTYDGKEAEKYRMPYFCEFESKIDIPLSKKYPLHDVFFAGKAKDRLDLLLKTYDRLVAIGIKPFYYITGVYGQNPPKREGIVYAKRNMPYFDMLYNSVNSKCILEINQEGAVGYTSRFLEAVMYNKKLLTNNVSIRKSKFYNENYIQIFSRVEEIEKTFFYDCENIDYGYVNEFSPINMIYTIDEELKRMDGK